MKYRGGASSADISCNGRRISSKSYGIAASGGISCVKRRMSCIGLHASCVSGKASRCPRRSISSIGRGIACIVPLLLRLHNSHTTNIQQSYDKHTTIHTTFIQQLVFIGRACIRIGKEISLYNFLFRKAVLIALGLCAIK